MKVISKTEQLSKEGWLFTKEEVETKVREFLKLDPNIEIIRIDGFQAEYVTVIYSEKPTCRKEGDLIHELETEEKRITISEKNFFGLFGIKPVYRKIMSIEGRTRKDGIFLQTYHHPNKYVFPEDDMFYFITIEEPYHDIIEEVKDGL